MIDLSPPGAVVWICRTLEKAGHETWAVGGAVRDALAGLPSGDWDLTTRARPQQVRRLFPRTVPIGVDHGTVGVLARDGTMYEVTTFRRDVETTGRHAVVAFADSLDEDLARRDFTINAVAWHPLRKVIHDPHGGRGDLEAGILRTVGDPAERFAEDYLRVLRALRFAGTFQLQVEGESWRALVQAVPEMGILSPERVREEMEKILAADRRIRPSAALSLYAASGVLAFLYPELDALVGRRDDRRGGDLWSHALRTVNRLSPRDPERRWTALLSRIGEAPESMGAGEEGETVRRRGLLRAAALLKRLRSSNARIDRVAGTVPLIREPPRPDAPEAELRRWISAVERERVPDVLAVWAAEARSDEARGGEACSDAPQNDAPWSAGEGAWTRDGYLELARRLRRICRSQVPLAVGELAFSGRDLIRMGYRPGPHFGELLEDLLEQVLEDPERNEPEWLAQAAERWMQARTEEG
jgi:tRNA nucleotidyltransferase (CCA-adding enzyme)